MANRQFANEQRAAHLDDNRLSRLIDSHLSDSIAGRLIRPGVDATSMAAVARDRAVVVVEPGEAVWGDGCCGNRLSVSRRHMGEPPRTTDLPRLQQQVVMPAARVIRRVGVF